jgi:hypothetical protein
MVRPREEFLGSITLLDEDSTGSIDANNAEIQSVNGVLHNGLTIAPTTGADKGAFWVEDGTPTLPKFTDSAGNTITLADINSISQDGYVSGPGSSVDSELVLFDGITGEAIKGTGGKARINISGNNTSLEIEANGIGGQSALNFFENGSPFSNFFISYAPGLANIESTVPMSITTGGAGALNLIGDTVEIEGSSGVVIDVNGVVWQWASSDGAAGHALITDGYGNLSFADVGDPLTAPENPDDDYRIAIALNGDLDYSEASKLTPDGTLLMVSTDVGDSLVPVIDRTYDATYGSGVSYGNCSWISTDASKIWFDTSLQFSTTLATAFISTPNGRLGFDSTASAEGIAFTTFTGSSRGYLAQAHAGNSIGICIDLPSLVLIPEEEILLSPSGTGGTTIRDGLSISWNSSISNNVIKIEDGCPLLIGTPGVSVTIPSSSFGSCVSIFEVPSAPNYLNTRTPYSLVSKGSRTTWRETFDGYSQHYEYDGNVLIGHGSVNENVTTGAKLAHIVRNYEVQSSGLAAVDTAAILTPASLELYDGTSDVCVGWTLRGICVGLSSPVFIERKGSFTYRDATSDFNEGSSSTIFNNGAPTSAVNVVRTALGQMKVQVTSGNFADWSGGPLWYLRLEMDMVRGPDV